MSLNQIYYDPTKPFAVSSQSNIKANQIRCNTFESETVDTENIIADNLTVLNINGAPYQAGALPVLGNNNDLLMVKGGNAVWSQNLVIDASPVTFEAGSTFNCLSDVFNVTSDNFTMAATNAAIKGDFNIEAPSTITFENTNANVSTIVMEGTTINMNSVNQTMQNNSNIFVNNGSVVLDGTTFLQTPQVRFAASISNSLKFYGEYRQNYNAVWADAPADQGTSIGIQTNITIYFTRIGRMINMMYPRQVFTQVQDITDQYFVLKPINPAPEYNFYWPNPQVVFTYSNYQSVDRVPKNTLGIFYFNEGDVIFTSTVSTGLFSTLQETNFIIGGVFKDVINEVGGISVSYFRDSDV